MILSIVLSIGFLIVGLYIIVPEIRSVLHYVFMSVAIIALLALAGYGKIYHDDKEIQQMKDYGCQQAYTIVNVINNDLIVVEKNDQQTTIVNPFGKNVLRNMVAVQCPNVDHLILMDRF